METAFSIDGQHFSLLGTQRGGAAVYRGDAASYLRLGSREAIARDLGLHRAMEKAHYPVAPILAEGELGHLAYFIEKSLGDRSFRVIFQEDVDASRHISKEHFEAFIAVMKKLFSAQLRAREPGWHIGEFAHGINLLTLTGELPDYADALHARFDTACAHLKHFPGTLTHGDCNPSNVYADGIIDLEDSFRAPLGYDAISALVTIEWSPATRDHEFYAQYRFNQEQKEQYVRVFDSLAAKSKIIGLSKYVDDLAFCRAVWLCSGMREWPRIQQWRYEKLITQYLS